ncbi:MAG: RusA family crossover junction endodeoxyribonuclease [Candidatus Woesearchaeota archaeon]
MEKREIIIDIEPCSAVRMTNSDRWKKENHVNPNLRMRKCVKKYFDFKRKLLYEFEKNNINLKDELNIVFYLKIPDSLSSKKKDLLKGSPHKKRPDLDNLVKAVMDAVRKEDGDIFKIIAEKRYSDKNYPYIKIIV